MGEREREFLSIAVPAATAELRDVINGSNCIAWGPSYRRHLNNTALALARKYVLPWLADQQQYTKAEYGRIQARFVTMTRDFTEALYGEDAVPKELEDSPALPGSNAPLPSFQFAEILRIAWPASPFRYLADVIAGALQGSAYFAPDAEAFLAYVMEVNASRAENAVEDRLQSDRVRLSRLLRARLAEMSQSVGAMLEHAKATLALGRDAVAAELALLRRLEAAARSMAVS